MDKKAEDKMVIATLLKRFTEQRLPRTLKLRDKVFLGEKLNDFDIEYLNNVFKDAQHILKLSDKYPEYQEIVSNAMHLYKEITEKALSNEK